MLLSSSRNLALRTAHQLRRQIATTAPQHIVIALGGNALLKRGEPMTMENQRQNIRKGIRSLQPVVANNKVTIVHGNGPQSGLLLLESSAYEKQTGIQQMQLDVIDAETEGMIGYLIEQELQQFVKSDRGMATVLTQVIVDGEDPAFLNPTKFIGPIMEKSEAETLGLPVKPDGAHYRRVVPSPLPIKVLDHEMKALQMLTDANVVVICAGGGGIPVIENPDGSLTGIEAVIDKDRAACMVGAAFKADGLLILTDVPGVATDFASPNQRFIKRVSAGKLSQLSSHFPDGSMGPKCESAIQFVNLTDGWAAIGNLNDADSIVEGRAGTRITKGADDFIEYYPLEST